LLGIKNTDSEFCSFIFSLLIIDLGFFNINMATHECSACLCETIQGDVTPRAGLVLAISACAAPPGTSHHNWVRKSKISPFILMMMLSKIIFILVRTANLF
jgi:hypothetical protein